MKDLLKNIFNRIKDTGTATIDTTYLKDNSWFHVAQDVTHIKTVYIFRNNGELLVSRNGEITKAKWENIVHSANSLIIEIAHKPQLFNIIYLTSEYLVIQKDGTESIEVFIKQQRYQSKLPKDLAENTIEAIFDDLNKHLNSSNISKSNPVVNQLEPNNSGEKAFNLKSEVADVFRRTEKLIERSKQEDGKYTFDYLDELDLLKSKGVLNNKDDETDFIIEMQRFEEILIEKGLFCTICKSLSTIEKGVCTYCNPEFPVEEILKLMKEHSITFNNGKFQYLDYKYDKFKDALNYALLMKEKSRD